MSELVTGFKLYHQQLRVENSLQSLVNCVNWITRPSAVATQSSQAVIPLIAFVNSRLIDQQLRAIVCSLSLLNRLDKFYCWMLGSSGVKVLSFLLTVH